MSLHWGRVRIGLAAALAAAAWLLTPPAPTNAQQRSDFDHLRSGFPLTGAHERVSCESCHLRGVFEGTPTNCATCHNDGAPWQAGGKNLHHIRSSDQCGDCHVTNSWKPARFDHMGVTAPCITCHNGASAKGKPPNHVPSGNDCETCHRTLAWKPATFDHSMVTGNCFSCHNGSTATGKPPDHPPSSNDCETCHNTMNWRVTRFDHTGITGNCFSCHNGSTATGKPPNHPPSPNTCENCHNTASWMTTGGFDHAGITGNCGSCHNGSTATGKSPNHFMTSLDCAECHNTAGWLPARYRHTGPNYPGDHAGNPECRACHTSNAQTIQWRFAAYAPTCAGCHANDFEPGEHRQPLSALRDCGECHRVNRGDW